MNKTKEKKIIKILLYLLQYPRTKEDILQKFKIREGTFYKYIQYIKDSGFTIKKQNGFYYIFHFSKKIELNKTEELIMTDLLFCADSYLSKSKSKIFTDHIFYVLQNSNKTSFDTIKKLFEEQKKLNSENNIKNKIQQIQELVDKGKVVEILTKQNKRYLTKIFNVIFDKDKVFVLFYNKKEKCDQKILIDSIKKTEIIEDFNIYKGNTTETIFQLTNKLSKSYILKENERIVDKFDDKIIIANSSNNKKYLFKRLLRYDEYCKILFPKSDVEKFKLFLKEATENIKA